MPLFGPRLPVLNWPAGNRNPPRPREVPARGSPVAARPFRTADKSWERGVSPSPIPARPLEPVRAPVVRPVSPSPSAPRTLEPARPPTGRPVSPSPSTARPTPPANSSPAVRSNSSSIPAGPARSVRSRTGVSFASGTIATAAFAKVVDALLEAGKDAAKDSAEQLIVDGVHKLLEELTEVLSDHNDVAHLDAGAEHETPLVHSLQAHEKLPISKTVHLVENVDGVATTYLAAIVVLQKVDAAEVGIDDDLFHSIHPPPRPVPA